MSARQRSGRDDSWAALTLAVLSGLAVTALYVFALWNPAPVHWPDQRSPEFALEHGVAGSWSPRFTNWHTRFPYRLLLRESVVSTEGSNALRVFVHVEPPEAARASNSRMAASSGFFPVGDGSVISEIVEVDPRQVQRIDWRVEGLPGRGSGLAGGIARLRISGRSDSEFDTATPSLIGATLLFVLAFLPAIVWFRRERSTARSSSGS